MIKNCGARLTVVALVGPAGVTLGYVPAGAGTPRLALAIILPLKNLRCEGPQGAFRSQAAQGIETSPLPWAEEAPEARAE